MLPPHTPGSDCKVTTVITVLLGLFLLHWVQRIQSPGCCVHAADGGENAHSPSSEDFPKGCRQKCPEERSWSEGSVDVRDGYMHRLHSVALGGASETIICSHVCQFNFKHFQQTQLQWNLLAPLGPTLCQIRIVRGLSPHSMDMLAHEHCRQVASHPWPKWYSSGLVQGEDAHNYRYRSSLHVAWVSNHCTVFIELLSNIAFICSLRRKQRWEEIRRKKEQAREARSKITLC